MPDIISKLAFDPSSRVHFEIAGRNQRRKTVQPHARRLTSPSSAAAAPINANLELLPGLRLVTNNFWSDGEGRYLFGEVPDFIVRADGSPSLIHAGSTVSRL